MSTNTNTDTNAEKRLVVTGNPVDGLFFYGPFDDSDQATSWAERNHPDDDWWLAPLVNPEAYEAENEELPDEG